MGIFDLKDGEMQSREIGNSKVVLLATGANGAACTKIKYTNDRYQSLINEPLISHSDLLRPVDPEIYEPERIRQWCWLHERQMHDKFVIAYGSLASIAKSGLSDDDSRFISGLSTARLLKESFFSHTSR